MAKKPSQETKDRPALARITEAAKFLNISRAYAYKLIEQGDIPVKYIGSTKRVPWVWLDAQVAFDKDAQ